MLIGQIYKLGIYCNNSSKLVKVKSSIRLLSTGHYGLSLSKIFFSKSFFSLQNLTQIYIVRTNLKHNCQIPNLITRNRPLNVDQFCNFRKKVAFYNINITLQFINIISSFMNKSRLLGWIYPLRFTALGVIVSFE